MGVWLRIQQEGELFDREGGPKKEKRIVGPVIFWSPDWHEYTVVPLSRVGELKYILSITSSFPLALSMLAKKGLPVFLYPFTNVDFYDILKEKGISMATFHCSEYSRRVSPAICLANKIKWPRQPPQEREEEIRFVKRQAKYENDPDILKKLKKRIRVLSQGLDPYPHCRRCKMANRLEKESCLGVDFSITDQSCLECPDRVECCHLMRMRVQKLLEGYPEEVIKSLSRQTKVKLTSRELTRDSWEDIIDRKQEELHMAKKKKSAEVEVIPAVPEALTDAEKKKARRDARVARKEKEKETAAQEAAAASRKGQGKKREAEKPLTKKAMEESIQSLLKDLAKAKEAKDDGEARKLRGKLRGLGYHLSKVKKS